MVDASSEHAGFTNPLKVMKTLRKTHKAVFAATPRSAAHPMPWPAGFDPKKNAVYARNDIAIAAPASAVFARIARAPGWPAYYPNSADVRVEGGAPADAEEALAERILRIPLDRRRPPRGIQVDDRAAVRLAVAADRTDPGHAVEDLPASISRNRMDSETQSDSSHCAYGPSPWNQTYSVARAPS